MSLGKDIQKAEAKIKALEAQVQSDDEAKSALAQQIESAKAEHDAVLKAATEAAEAIKVDMQAKIDAANAQIKALQDTQNEVVAELQKAQEEAKAAKAEAEAAKQRLNNPAFAEAAAPGVAPVAATAEPTEGKAVTLFAQYQAITDHAARTKFWNEHEAEIHEETRALLNA